MAEWPIAAVLKTAVGQPTVGSNPTSSVSFSSFLLTPINLFDLVQIGQLYEQLPNRICIFRGQGEIDEIS